MMKVYFPQQLRCPFILNQQFYKMQTSQRRITSDSALIYLIFFC